MYFGSLVLAHQGEAPEVRWAVPVRLEELDDDVGPLRAGLRGGGGDPGSFGSGGWKALVPHFWRARSRLCQSRFLQVE